MNSIKFTIITPTILRDSLFDTCTSIDRQTYENWTHIVMVDKPVTELTEHDKALVHEVEHYGFGKRIVHFCNISHKDYGNTCRSNAYDFIPDDTTYLGYIDDDDYYTPDAFGTIVKELSNLGEIPNGLLFPCYRHGSIFFNYPPGHSQTASCQYFVKPTIDGVEMRWGKSDGYCADGEYLEFVKKHTDFKTVSENKFLSVVPKSNYGK